MPLIPAAAKPVRGARVESRGPESKPAAAKPADSNRIEIEPVESFEKILKPEAWGSKAEGGKPEV